MNGMKKSESSGSYQCFAAASAAVANEVNLILYIFTELYQVIFPGFLKKIHPFGNINSSGNSMTYQGISTSVECHANIQRGITVFSYMCHFVPAITLIPIPMMEAVFTTSEALS